jgi:hypothetical protein
MNQLKKSHFPLPLLIIGLLFFMALAGMAIKFYQERLLTFDSAYYCFQIIRLQAFDIEAGRISSYLPQTLPLLALKSGCSLVSFLKLYSFSYVMVDFLIFCVIFFILKNYRAAVAFLLTLCIGYVYAWYITVDEVFLALSFTILLYDIVAPPKEYSGGLKKGCAVIVSCVLILIIATSHLIGLLAVMFVLLSEVIIRKKYKDPLLWSLLIFTTGLLFCESFIKVHNQYEAAKMPSLKFIFETLPHLFSLPAAKFFYGFIQRYFHALIALFLLCVFSLIFQKRWLASFFLILFPFGLMSMIFIINYNGSSYFFHQNYYPVLGLIVAVATANIFYDYSKKGIALLILSFILAYNVTEIYKAHFTLQKHFTYMDHLVEFGHKQTQRKFIIDNRTSLKHLKLLTGLFHLKY